MSNCCLRCFRPASYPPGLPAPPAEEQAVPALRGEMLKALPQLELDDPRQLRASALKADAALEGLAAALDQQVCMHTLSKWRALLRRCACGGWSSGLAAVWHCHAALAREPPHVSFAVQERSWRAQDLPGLLRDAHTIWREVSQGSQQQRWDPSIALQRRLSGNCAWWNLD